MTPGDLIADLRDIQTPPATGEAAALLSPAPLIAFIAVLMLGVLWSYRRRTAWRREGRRRLESAKTIRDPASRWSALVTLYKLTARHAVGVSRPPDYLFQPIESLEPKAERRLIADIERRLG